MNPGRIIMSEVEVRLQEMILLIVAENEKTHTEYSFTLKETYQSVDDSILLSVIKELIADSIDEELRQIATESIQSTLDTPQEEGDSKYFEIPLHNKDLEQVPINGDDEKDEIKEEFFRSNEIEYFTFTENVHSDTYRKLWNERKRALEKEAERKARLTAKQWQREKIPLRKIIDDSLKEYIDLYEKANSLYLQFEHEKSEWINRIRNQIFPGNCCDKK